MGAQVRRDPATIARELGVSEAAVELAHDSDFIDLHVDTFIPLRIFGYDPLKRHGRGPTGGRFMGQLDLPRATDGGLDGGMWSITTNPFRRASRRWQVFKKNLERFGAVVDGSGGRLARVASLSQYREAKASGAHAVMLAIQGGNALEAAPEGVASVPGDWLLRVTLVHLTSSCYGGTSSPLGGSRTGKPDLSDAGRRLVEQLDEQRIFVDLAHIHKTAFWQAVDAHDKALPLICTHTGVEGVCPHWRNLDDEQIKAVADTGGVVGVMFHTPFLARDGGPGDAEMVVEHMEHVVEVAGEDAVAVGTDYDGMIVPPKGLRGAETFPRLVQALLDRSWTEERIRKALGANFLRSLGELRG